MSTYTTTNMLIRQTPDEYLFHLEVTNPSDAKRMWKDRIKDNWGRQCAYCGSNKELTLDHVKPRSLGGLDTSKNVVCCCRECNQSKGRHQWEDWYYRQDFFNWERLKALEEWIQPPKKVPSFCRLNVCYADAA